MPALRKARIRFDSAIGAVVPLLSPTPEQSHEAAPAPGNSRSPSLRCPRCRHTLIPVWEGELQCTRKSRPHTYPIVAGIPDLRATLDADITVARERADARLLAEMLARGPLDADGLDPSFEDDAHGASPRTSDAILDDWQDLDADAPAVRMVIDVGCKSGALLEAAARRWPVCVGVDTSLRRLVVARHRLQQAGVRARMVCANVDALPFVDGLFDRVIAEWVLELSPRKERALREWNRMLSGQGRLWLSTSNRWSMSRDPKLGIPALSWLPMQLVDLWARWHGLTFPQRTMVGRTRLRALLEETGFMHVRLGQPATKESDKTPLPDATPPGRKTIYDFRIVREIATRVRPMILATAGPRHRAQKRVRYDRYVARLAL